MEKREYAFSEANPPEESPVLPAGEVAEAIPRDGDTLARIEAKLDAVLAANGLGVAVDGEAE